MKIVVLDAVTLGDDIDLSALYELGDLKVYPNTSQEQLLERLHGVDVAITNKVAIHRDQMEKLPQLKLICLAATGMDIIDLEAAQNLSIDVKNVKDYSGPSVAQHVFAMVLNLLHHLPYYHSKATSPSWEESGVFTCLDRPYWELQGKRWGIIGLGHIGKEVAKRAEVFGCEIVYHSVSGNAQPVSYTMLELDELLKTSDVISVHCPLTPITKNLLNVSHLIHIQDHAILINVARGAVINSADLVRVKKGNDFNKKFKVALDVFDTEPLPAEHILQELCGMEDVLMSPHIAWGSIEARQRLIKSIVKNISSTNILN
jgi:lactate dehydrogenase-like 2-hydroxyacid dehydrogenase